jgi:metal-responsive CopG/Arc/MetJ family transcriptional regulator
MMKKAKVSFRLPEDLVEFLDKIAEENGIPRSRAVELVTNIARDYFSDNQISLEHQVRDYMDGRSKKFRD